MSGALTTIRSNVPDHYDPHKGLKAATIAEAAEKMFARAKDSEALYEAIAVKLAEQRKFVLWWDAQEKHPGNRNGSAVGGLQQPKIEEFGLNRDIVHRWRKRLTEERKYEATLEAAQERCRRVCEADKGSTELKGASGSGENEWYTPDEYLEAARDVMGGIDLDPASSDDAQAIVKAGSHFTAADDGLAQEWHGRVWLNPPYTQPDIANFVSKMVDQHRQGRLLCGIMLTHNYTDTAWFHEASSIADAICFTRGRIKFYDAKGNVAAPTQGQAFFYFGADIPGFASRFQTIGRIVTPFDGEV